MRKKLEIEISTYNRCKILKNWLDSSLEELKRLEIGLAIYDSSTNNETQQLIEEWNKADFIYKIKYVRLNEAIRVDEKVLQSIMQSDYEYVLPVGDSRIFLWEQFEKKVIPLLEEIDFCCVYSFWGKSDKDGRYYEDANSFFNDCFWHTTLLGGIIFKQSVFGELRNNDRYVFYVNKFNRNDGFSYLGIFYNLIAKKRIKAVFRDVEIINVSDKKTPGWLKRYLEVWCGNLCYMVDNLDDIYNQSKDKVLRDVWKILELDGIDWCYKARKANGLTSELYNKYNNEGAIDKVLANKKKLKFYAKGNMMIISLAYYVHTTYRNVKCMVKKTIKKSLGEKNNESSSISRRIWNKNIRRNNI